MSVLHFLSDAIRPPIPTRDQICTYFTSGMQGLMVQTQQYGLLPWWDAALAWLDIPADRQAVYAAKRTMRDTHQIIELPSGDPLYNEEDGQNAYAPSKGFGARDWTNGNTRLDPKVGSLVQEVLNAGFYPELVLNGDNGEAGYPIASTQLPIVTRDLAQYQNTLIIRGGWDGVFYGWDPQHIVDFGARFRSLWPTGILCIEMSTGHIPLGEGASDWTTTGRMKDYDILLVEFNPDTVHEDTNWQIAGRLLGPQYRRPADQPAGDDPSPPWYMSQPSPRGPFHPIAFEIKTEYWVRPGRTSLAAVQADQNYLRGCGWPIVC